MDSLSKTHFLLNFFKFSRLSLERSVPAAPSGTLLVTT